MQALIWSKERARGKKEMTSGGKDKSKTSQGSPKRKRKKIVSEKR